MKHNHPNLMARDRSARHAGTFDLRVNPWGLLSACGVIALMATVLGFGGRLWWIFDLFSHFRVQWLAALSLTAALGLSGEIRFISESEVPSVVAEIDLPAGSITVVGTHAVPPASAENTRLRDQHLLQLPEIVRGAISPVLLLGDLNATPWCSIFRNLLRESGLRDSSKGRGVQPTWPTFMPLCWIPIDHCLYGPGIHVTDKFVGPQVGSDHYPVVVDFTVGNGFGD
jgi:endonuclease/exonuclease/phosphatase (EEP) superfamily protein YafD